MRLSSNKGNITQPNNLLHLNAGIIFNFGAAQEICHLMSDTNQEQDTLNEGFKKVRTIFKQISF